MSTSLEVWIRKFNLSPTGTLHAGAHFAQERDVYAELNMEPVLWVEAHPQIASQAERLLSNYPNQHIVNAALWNEPGCEIEFSEAGNEGSSSSLLELKYITASHPEVFTKKKFLVLTRTLEEVLSENEEIAEQINFLCLDTQGAEAQVIDGIGSFMAKIHYVLSEVSIKPLYKGTMLFEEFTSKIEGLGFKLIASRINRTTGWGEALFVRSEVIESKKIKYNDSDHIIYFEKRAFGTWFRNLMIALGVTNKSVSKLRLKH